MTVRFAETYEYTGIFQNESKLSYVYEKAHFTPWVHPTAQVSRLRGYLHSGEDGDREGHLVDVE